MSSFVECIELIISHFDVSTGLQETYVFLIIYTKEMVLSFGTCKNCYLPQIIVANKFKKISIKHNYAELSFPYYPTFCVIHNDKCGAFPKTHILLNIKHTRNYIIIIIIIEHLLKRIYLTVHQSSCRFTLIDMIINRHVRFNMLRA